MKTLLLTRRFPLSDLALIRKRLRDKYEVVEWPGDGQAVGVASGAEVALGNALSGTVLAAASRLRLFQVAGAGTDRLDLEALAAREVTVANSHSAAPFVAETAVALALALVKGTVRRDQGLRQGDWRAGPSGTLVGCRLGFLGFGHVGQYILRLLAGWRVPAVAWSLDRESGPDLPPVGFMDRDDVLARSQVIFLCLPLTRATRGCIGARELDLIGPDGYLVNVARAGLVVEDDLFRALHERRIAGAGLDVWWEGPEPGRPPSVHHPFHELDNVVVSPYCAGHGSNAPHLADALDNLIRYAETGRVGNIVSVSKGY